MPELTIDPKIIVEVLRHIYGGYSDKEEDRVTLHVADVGLSAPGVVVIEEGKSRETVILLLAPPEALGDWIRLAGKAQIELEETSGSALKVADLDVVDLESILEAHEFAKRVLEPLGFNWFFRPQSLPCYCIPEQYESPRL